MNGIRDWVDSAGGVLRTRDLKGYGARDRDLTRAVRDGSVRRVRRGWYTTLASDDPRSRALAVGGRLTGASALFLLDAWLWDEPRHPTVSVPRSTARVRRPPGMRVVHDPPRVTARGAYGVVDPRDALARAVIELDFEEAVAVWDWALNSDLFDETDLLEVERILPADARGLVTWTTEKSDSILESVARVRCVARGYSVASQVPVGDRQRIDLVLDDVVAIELDGKEFHDKKFEDDRLKDLAIVIESRSPLRLTYTTVRRRWSRVVTAIATSARNHRRGGFSRPGVDHEVVHTLATCRRRITPRGRRRWRCAPEARVAPAHGAPAPAAPASLRPPR